MLRQERGRETMTEGLKRIAQPVMGEMLPSDQVGMYMAFAYNLPALALPVFTSSARGALPEARCSLATCTGAAQKRFWVNTPQTRALSASDMRSRSLRPDLRMPDSAMPSLTPFTGSRSPGRGGLKLTAIRLGAGSLASSTCRDSACIFFPTRTGRDRCGRSSPSA